MRMLQLLAVLALSCAARAITRHGELIRSM